LEKLFKIKPVAVQTGKVDVIGKVDGGFNLKKRRKNQFLEAYHYHNLWHKSD
jgi:hypothetical protein